MRINILKPGILSTLQDMGRHLYLADGVPVSGAMDTLSLRFANIALGNHANAAVIEFTYAHAALKAETDLLIAWCGDGAVLKLGAGDVPDLRPVFIPAGNSITLHNNPSGSRTYLAVAGGWDVPEALGSRSTYLAAAMGGFRGRQLQAGDELESDKQLSATSENILHSLLGNSANYTNWSLARNSLLPENRKTIRVMMAHEVSWFEKESVAEFLSAPYRLSKSSNRMGYHLEGIPIRRVLQRELLSTAVTVGTIQVTGDGSLVLLMADCQTTGGYPRIAQVAAVDLPLCGQLKPGDNINFKEITHREAETLYINREKQLQRIALAVRDKYI
jgi:antagonist of KipI